MGGHVTRELQGVLSYSQAISISAHIGTQCPRISKPWLVGLIWLNLTLKFTQFEREIVDTSKRIKQKMKIKVNIKNTFVKALKVSGTGGKKSNWFRQWSPLSPLYMTFSNVYFSFMVTNCKYLSKNTKHKIYVYRI